MWEREVIFCTDREVVHFETISKKISSLNYTPNNVMNFSLQWTKTNFKCSDSQSTDTLAYSNEKSKLYITHTQFHTFHGSKS